FGRQRCFGPGTEVSLGAGETVGGSFGARGGHYNEQALGRKRRASDRPGHQHAASKARLHVVRRALSTEDAAGPDLHSSCGPPVVTKTALAFARVMTPRPFA